MCLRLDPGHPLLPRPQRHFVACDFATQKAPSPLPPAGSWAGICPATADSAFLTCSRRLSASSAPLVRHTYSTVWHVQEASQGVSLQQACAMRWRGSCPHLPPTHPACHRLCPSPTGKGMRPLSYIQSPAGLLSMETLPRPFSLCVFVLWGRRGGRGRSYEGSFCGL